jgi:hypothetical protein
LKEAAEVIQDTPSALQLRYLQTLNSIAAEKNSTIVFPIPMELFRGLISHNGPRPRRANRTPMQSPSRRRDEERQHEPGTGCAFDVQRVHSPPPQLLTSIGKQPAKALLTKERSTEERSDRLAFTLPL